MNADREHLEERWQADALRPPRPDEPEAVAAYRRLYAGIRWAPMPALDPGFTARALARAGIVDVGEDLTVERRALPWFFAAFGIGGGLTAGPQLLGALGQVAFDAAGLPWLQAAAAVSAIAVAAAVDRVLGRRRGQQLRIGRGGSR